MVRRLQLMEPERRVLRTRLAEAAAGLRDGLLRDNKVLPPVLAALALVIFAWLFAGVIIGDPEEDRVARQAAQPSVSQAPDDGSGSSGSPAPGVENRDSESLDVYESKDPFRELFPTADAGDAAADDPAAGGDTTGATDDGTSDSDTGSDTDGTGTGDGSSGTGAGSGDGSGGTGSGDGSGGTGSGNGSGSGGDQYGGDGQDDFLDQTSPGDPGFDNNSGNGTGSAGSGNGSGQYGGGGDGNGDLFDSGGDLGR